MMHSKLTVLLIFTLFCSGIACRCVFPPTLYRTYYSTDVVNYMKATVISSTPDNGKGLIKYKLAVAKNYKGCAPTRIVNVYTGKDSCGVILNVGSQYVLPLRAGKTPVIHLCDFIAEYKMLSRKEREFLDSRFVCCKNVCKCANGERPVNCVKDPCDPRIATPPCKEAKKCVSNFCGGCFAEWFDDEGFPACM